MADVHEYATCSGLFGPIRDKSGYTDKSGMRLAALRKAFFSHLNGNADNTPREEKLDEGKNEDETTKHGCAR